MNRTQVLRMALGASVPFNLFGAAVFAFPGSPLGELIGLPGDVAMAYRATVAFFVILFGGAYGWLALQPQPDRPMVAFAAIGKICFFFVLVLLWMMGEAPALGVAAGSGDLVLGCVFAWGLMGSRT